MQKGTGLFWFRNDLRITDNLALQIALEESDLVIPVFLLDQRLFKDHFLGFKKTSIFRAQFMLQSLQNLRQSCKAKGGDLLVLIGKPEEVIPELTVRYGVNKIFASKEITWEEVKVEEALEYRLKGLSVTIQYEWQHSLVHPDDLPFGFDQVPDVFSNYRKQIEKNCKIRKPVPAPTKIPVPDHLESYSIPSLKDLGFDQVAIELRFNGGEEEAWKRLNHYFWQQDLLKNYKFTRNGLLGEDYSSKFSPWLAHGCISPRSIHEQVKKYERERLSNVSTYWLVFELHWRDYFRNVAAKYGNQLFFKKGFKSTSVDLKDDAELFQKWAMAETGIPFIDANMKELNQTGFMSNRGRQNVASFLVKDLKVNWTWGAAYFESQLIDYDVTSNWGNWAYMAGVGNDPRQNRYFNIMKQAQQYDPKGVYVKHWLPQLLNLESSYVHNPTVLQDEHLQNAGVNIGDNYPKNLVPFRKWLK